MHKGERLESRIFWSIAISRREKLGSHSEIRPPSSPNRGADEYLDNDQIPWKGEGETKRNVQTRPICADLHRTGRTIFPVDSQPTLGLSFLFDSRPDITTRDISISPPSLPPLDWRNTPMDGSTLEAFTQVSFFFWRRRRDIFLFIIILYVSSRIFSTRSESFLYLNIFFLSFFIYDIYLCFWNFHRNVYYSFVLSRNIIVFGIFDR